VLGRHAGGEQALLDALRAPGVDLAAILGEAPRVRGVVEVAPLAQRGECLLDDVEVDAAFDEVAAELRNRVVAAPQPLPGELERLLERVARKGPTRTGGGAGQGPRRPGPRPPRAPLPRPPRRARSA
jgi:hypothetical protein